MRYVALPSAKPDKSSYGERALIEKGLPYLRLRWKSDDWRVYEVLLPAPLVISQRRRRIVLEQFQSDELLLDVKRPGEAIVKVRWTPYWFASHACVEPYGDWTKVIANEAGFVHMSTRFAPERLFSRGRRCDDSTWLAGQATLDARALDPSAPGPAGPGLAPERALAAQRLARRHPPARAVRRRLLPVPDRARLRGRAGRPRVRERAQRSWTPSARSGCSSSRASRPGPRAQEWLLTFANWMYVNSHFVITTTFLIWLYIARNHAFYFVRNMFMVAMGLALVGYMAFPTAPPRFLPEWGFSDSVANFVGENGRAERERALQPVRRRAEHARGVRAHDRRAGDHPRASTAC